jgi:hypothetical protein
MKKGITLLTGSLLAIVFHASAQFQPGTLMVGSTLGTTAYTSGTSDYAYDNGNSRSTSNKAFSLTAGPQLGVFVSSNVVIGGTISVTATNTRNNTSTVTSGVQGTNDATSTNYTVGFGPFVRVYFANQPANNLFYMQIHGNLATGSGTSSGDGASPSSSYHSTGSVSNILNWNAGGSLGITHLFNKHVGMDIALGYLYSRSRSDNANSTQTVNSNNGNTTTSSNNYTLTSPSNGINFTLGFHWFLFN